jgi:hypothetical protein
LKHLSANNYGIAALVLRQKRTADMANETVPDSVRTKAEIMEYVKGPFTALHKAVATIEEKNVVQLTASPSQVAEDAFFVRDGCGRSLSEDLRVGKQ